MITVLPVNACPICGKTGTYDEVTDCIKNHNVPDEMIGIDGFNTELNASAFIMVKCKNGKVLRYAAWNGDSENV
jgi:hypothetical protein